MPIVIADPAWPGRRAALAGAGARPGAGSSSACPARASCTNRRPGPCGARACWTARLAAASVTVRSCAGPARCPGRRRPWATAARCWGCADRAGPSWPLAAKPVSWSLSLAQMAASALLLRDVATLTDVHPPATRYVWHTQRQDRRPAVTLAVTKKAAKTPSTWRARRAGPHVEASRNTLIPRGRWSPSPATTAPRRTTRRQTDQNCCSPPAASVVARWLPWPWGGAGADLGIAVGLTLTPRCSSWAWGFAQPRVAVCAGDLPRHPGGRYGRGGGKHPSSSGAQTGRAFDERSPALSPRSGGPTILATLTVIHAAAAPWPLSAA